MRRILSEFAYGPGPRSGCWWDETIEAPHWPEQVGAAKADVVVIGGGFTGVSTALHLARRGVDVAVLEAETPGFGASGRNGGFCCLGGSRLSRAAIVRAVGQEGARAYAQAEKAAVDLVGKLVEEFGLSIDRHSDGEMLLAHSPRAMNSLREAARTLEDDFGQPPELLSPRELPGAGFGTQFFGGLRCPIGFALNPRKYLFGLAGAAQGLGGRLFQKSPARTIERISEGYRITWVRGAIRCRAVVIATNGYSSEDLCSWMAGRYMPTQSSVLVTRPLSDRELAAQRWLSDTMSYDTRNLLHYFRLMPDRRFLFGRRGGLFNSPKSERDTRAAVRRSFRYLFPAWSTVEITHQWSGLVCLSPSLSPFVSDVPGAPGVFAGFAYHGNGVAMGTLVGKLLAGLVDGDLDVEEVPALLERRPTPFPFGRHRSLIMPPIYASYALRDRFFT